MVNRVGIFRILGIAAFAGSVSLAGAQSMNVDIKGVVLDSRSGVLISGAAISLANNASIKATSDAQGKFTLSGQVVGIAASGAAASEGMALSSGALRFQADGSTPVKVEVFGLDSRKVKTLVDAKLSAGSYSLTSPMAGLPAGLYVVRGKVGSKTASFKLSSLGLQGSHQLVGSVLPAARLAKQAAEIIDTIKVVRDGYVTVLKPISTYTSIQQFDLSPKLAAGDLKIVSERGMPQVNWGLNVDVQVWDGAGANGSQLRGNFPNAFEGKESWLVKFVPNQAYSAWGFIANNYPEDMTAWADGAMHIAVKGTVPSLGITMGSPEQLNGSSIKVNATKYGYKPDNEWHEMNIPLSDFAGEGFSLGRISVYCGLVTPVDGDTIPFNTENFYQVDDIYWKLTK